MKQIAVINQATAISDADVQKMMPAFETQWNRDLGAVWGIESAEFLWVPKGQQPPAGSWWLVFLDNSDQAGALAYHDLTSDGHPLSKVFVKTLLADGASVSVGATHEICEMAVDPWINGAAQDAKGIFWAYEICDPVEDDGYGYKIGDVLVSDFVTPSWFGYAHSSGPFDFQGKVKKPFQVLHAGYAQKFDFRHPGWVQILGRDAAGETHREHAAPGSRRERRTRHDKWQRSDPRHHGHLPSHD